MAISTQAELVTAIQNWAQGRADLTAARCAEFMVLAEAKLNREIRALNMETKSTSFAVDAEYEDVPSGFLAVRSFQMSSGGVRYSLKLMPPEAQTNAYNDTGAPKFYSVVGTQFRFAPTPDATYTATLVYYATLTALGTTGGNTNWLLTNHPDIYLYGCMLEAAAYVNFEPNQIMLWKQGYDEGVAKLNGTHNRNRWSGPGLAIVPG